MIWIVTHRKEQFSSFAIQTCDFWVMILSSKPLGTLMDCEESVADSESEDDKEDAVYRR